MPLSVRKRPKCRDDLSLILSQRREIFEGTAGLQTRLLMSLRHEAPPELRAGQVEHDRSEVCRSRAEVPDALEVAVQTNECVLNDLLTGLAIVDEQTRQSNQCPVVITEESLEQVVAGNRVVILMRFCCHHGYRHLPGAVG